MKNDRDLIAGVIGVVAAIPCEIVIQVLIRLGFAKYSEFGMSSLLITLNRPSIILGFFVTSVVGGLISIILYQAFRKLGSQHLIIKCVGVSIFMWVALEFTFKIYFEGKVIPVRTMSSYYSHLAGAFIFGITQGILFRKYLFYKHIKNEPIEPKHMEVKPIDDKPINTKIIKEQHIDDKPIYDINKILK